MANKFYKVTAAAGDKPARLDLFGEVGGGFWSMGFDEATFKMDLDAAGVSEDTPLEIYVNSPGGSVYTALGIYNIIKRHKAAVVITVAGMAASAATIITSAPNARVIMPRGSVMLVHPVRMSADALTPEELQEAAENLEKIRVSVRDIYEQKTGLDVEKLDEMMGKETLLTADEAVALGFADEVDESTKVTNTAAAGGVMCNGLLVKADLFKGAPEGLIEAAPAAADDPKEDDSIMDIEKLKAEHPDLVEAIRTEGVQAGVAQERARLQAIEGVAVAGFEDLVVAAKFETGMSAADLAVAILKAQKEQAKAMLAARAEDADDLKGVAPGAIVTSKDDEEARKQAERDAVIKAGARAFSNLK